MKENISWCVPNLQNLMNLDYVRLYARHFSECHYIRLNEVYRATLFLLCRIKNLLNGKWSQIQIIFVVNTEKRLTDMALS